MASLRRKDGFPTGGQVQLVRHLLLHIGTTLPVVIIITFPVKFWLWALRVIFTAAGEVDLSRVNTELSILSVAWYRAGTVLKDAADDAHLAV